MIANVLAVALAVVMLAFGAVASAPVAGDRPAGVSDDPALRTEVADLLTRLDGTYGIAVESLDGSGTLLINADQVFPTASLYKLLVMYRVYQALEWGSLSLDDPLTITYDDTAEVEPDDEDLEAGSIVTVAEALEAMITLSSNSGAYALARNVGGWNRVLSAAYELDMNDTGVDDGFQSTPADMAHFFRLLAQHSLVSEQASREMISLLLRQRVNDRIPALLPNGTPVAHKTGELDEVRNDGGIVFGRGGSYVLVIMSSGVNPEQAIDAEAILSRMVYDHFGA